MSETLHKIDFSQDTLPAEVDLGNITPAQQEAIRKVSANRDATAYFTAAELTELKAFIASWETSTEFENFLRAQLDEWLASSDIVWETAEYNQQLNRLDAYAQDILFGRNWVLQSVTDSRAQDHLAVAFASSLIGQLASNQAIDSQEFERIVNNESPDFTAHLVTNLWLLQNTPATIEAGGKQNIICMDVARGTKFFNWLFAWDFTTQQEIQAELESANTSDAIEVDFTSLDSNILPQIETLFQRVVQDSSTAENPTNADTFIAQNSQKEGWFVNDLISGVGNKIGGLLDSIAKLFKYIASIFSKWEESHVQSAATDFQQQSTTVIEVPEEDINEAWNFFRAHNTIVIDWIPASAFQELFSDPTTISEDAKSIVEHIPLMSDQGDISVNLWSIFIETMPDKHDDAIQIPKIQRFMQEMSPDFSISNPDGSINTVHLQLLINKYQDFTIWKIDKEETDEALLFQTYFAIA